MLPGMVTKPRVAIVGAGNWGTALCLALRGAGYEIDAVVRSHGASSDKTRSDKSLKRARKLAARVGARGLTDLSRVRAELIWFCVPDAAIAEVAECLAAKVAWKGRVALHSSGALSSDELTVLRRRGASVASVHPMMTFVRGASLSGSKSSRPQPALAGVPFALEGDRAAVRVARRVVRDLGGRSYAILRKDKVAYHAWGTFASPLLTALLATTERVAELAGVSRKEAKQRMLPILQKTLANYAALGAAGAFSGPIIRGDVDTVKGHLRALRGAGIARAVYSALARGALEYLPARNKSTVMKELKSAGRRRVRQ